MAKRSRSSASKGEPILKKARRESEAEVSMPKVVLPGVEEQGEEEEEEEEVPVLRSRGLRSRGLVILVFSIMFAKGEKLTKKSLRS